MARTSTRGWKGCQLCKSHKNRAWGDPVRFERMIRKMGKGRRVTRRYVPSPDE